MIDVTHLLATILLSATTLSAITLHFFHFLLELSPLLLLDLEAKIRYISS